MTKSEQKKCFGGTSGNPNPLGIPEGLKNTEEAALKLGRKPSTLERWRRQRKGPVVTEFFGRPYYSDEDIRDFLESCKRPMVRNQSRRRQPETAA
jgi:hypothetical protein